MANSAVAGIDTDGRVYRTIEEMWNAELASAEDDGVEVADDSDSGSKVGKSCEWYDKALRYWQTVEASVDGVLGGFGSVSSLDLSTSAAFLTALMSDALLRRDSLRAADCGAGIGRVTKGLLAERFGAVDLVELDDRFLAKARTDLADVAPHCQLGFVCVGLQDFDPPPNSYDLVWIQWVLGHLHDSDLVSFLRRCRAALRPDGWIVVKENNAKTGFVVDKTDSSVTRSNELLQEIFAEAGLRVHKEQPQTRLPKGLFAVRMYALR